jgi:hypothetical protein
MLLIAFVDDLYKKNLVQEDWRYPNNPEFGNALSVFLLVY